MSIYFASYSSFINTHFIIFFILLLNMEMTLEHLTLAPLFSSPAILLTSILVNASLLLLFFSSSGNCALKSHDNPSLVEDLVK